MKIAEFLYSIWFNRRLLLSLTKSDFRQQYLGSYLGITWAFVQPTVTILIFWFVFQVGFKSKPINDCPFILWLTSGIIPWFFFSDSISNATNSVTSNSYLVKKVVFRISLLPIIKVLSSLIIHAFFLVFMGLLFTLYGLSFNVYWLQIFYYLFAMMVLIMGLSWITSSVMVFVRDINQFVVMILQFGFWMTPIFWELERVPERYRFLIKINPLAYLIDGYRDSMIHKVWFWEHPGYTIYYWSVTLTIFVVGGLTFRKLKPHFADVL